MFFIPFTHIHLLFFNTFIRFSFFLSFFFFSYFVCSLIRLFILLQFHPFIHSFILFRFLVLFKIVFFFFLLFSFFFFSSFFSVFLSFLNFSHLKLWCDRNAAMFELEHKVYLQGWQYCSHLDDRKVDNHLSPSPCLRHKK